MDNSGVLSSLSLCEALFLPAVPLDSRVTLYFACSFSAWQTVSMQRLPLEL